MSYKLIGIISIAATTLALMVSLANPQLAVADYNHNRIIDDSIFDNIYTMGAGQIDAFLNQFPGSCISTNNGFSTIDPAGYSPTVGFEYAGWTSAGQAIADAAQAYGLNPQVLLTTLQKEESLVTGGSGCSSQQYSAAMAFACPASSGSHSYSGINLYALHGTPVTSVSGTCVASSASVGFSQQVIHTAWFLKFGEQRSEGNIGWSVVKGGWINTDDPQACYSGPMTEGYRQICPSGATTFYDGYTTIDGATTHMDTGATAALYLYTPHFAGNQSFVTLFTNWFGSTTLPYAFKTPDSAAVYISINNTRVAVPYMGMLQDYGISPQSIQTLPDSTVNGIPTPTDGSSAQLSYIIKSPSDSDADGGTVYLITIDHRYEFQSMQQFNDFGFNQANIAYEPLSFIQSIPDGGLLSNYIETPTNSAFQVLNGQKRIIFTYQTLQRIDPGAGATPVSYYIAGLIPSAVPIVDGPAIVKYGDSDTAYLLDNGTYYNVPTYNAYTCWGFNGALNTPVYQVADNTYLSTITPASALTSCIVNDNNGNNYLLNNGIKYSIPGGYGLAAAPGMNQDLVNLTGGLPTSQTALKQYVKASQDAGIWYIQAGTRRSVPTYLNYLLLGLDPTQFSTIDISALGSIPTSSDVKLGNGDLVKSDTSAAVYAVSGNSRVLFATSGAFLAYGGDWSSIETYPEATLDADYPNNNVVVGDYLYDQTSNKVYIVDAQGCYALSPAQITAFGQNQSALASSQPYPTSSFPRLNVGSCQAVSTYIKSPTSALVYWVDNGQKHPISTWNALVTQSGSSNPYVITLSQVELDSITTGSGM